MKIHFPLSGCATMVIAFSTAISPCQADSSNRVTNPNVIYVEPFGRGLLFDVGLDHAIDDDFVVGVAFGRATTEDGEGNAATSATLIPFYLNYYLTDESSSIFLTAGADLVVNGSTVKSFESKFSGLEFPSTPVIPNVGWGYESRADSGFLFRLAGYGMLGRKLVPWLGLTLGYAF